MSEKGGSGKLNLGPKKLSEGVRIRFARNLGTLLKSGVPMLEALSVLASQEADGRMRSAIGELRAGVERGQKLSESMEHLGGGVFDGMFVNMVRAAEHSGDLAEALRRVAVFKEKRQKVRGKVRTSMTYPVVVMGASSILIAILMLLIVPRFETVYSDMLKGAELPALTAMVMGVSTFLQAHFWLFAGVIVLVYMGLRFGVFRKQGVMAGVLLNLPKLGMVVRKANVLLFSQTLYPLLRVGTPILEALEIALAGMPSGAMRRGILNVRGKIAGGGQFSEGLREEGIFPEMVVSMIAVAERTGNLSEVMEHISDAYDEEVDAELTRLAALIEPVMIVLLALIVGTIVIALFLPIVGIIEHLAR